MKTAQREQLKRDAIKQSVNEPTPLEQHEQVISEEAVLDEFNSRTKKQTPDEVDPAHT